MPYLPSDSIVAAMRRRPEYQQAVQNRLNLPSWRSAVPQTGDITGAFTEDATKSALRAKEAGIERTMRNANLGLETRKVDLAGRRLDFESKARMDRFGVEQKAANLRRMIAGEELKQGIQANRAAQGQGQIANWLEGAGLVTGGIRGIRAIGEAKKETAFKKGQMDTINKWVEDAKDDPMKQAAILSLSPFLFGK
ncbi:MAG: hypothetical protein V2B18_13480 [Pseudomonadota bacterium]